MMLSKFSIVEVISAFIVLFAVIDIIGSIPVIVDLRSKGKSVDAFKAASISFVLMVLFFYGGEMILRLFGVDIGSFAIAGGIIIFFVALEMILDIEVFRNQGPIKEATLVPLVFPLLAGPASFTTLLSLHAEYYSINILLAVLLNMVWVYFVVSSTERIEKFLGKSGIYIMRKTFGIILLAIAVKLFVTNIVNLS